MNSSFKHHFNTAPLKDHRRNLGAKGVKGSEMEPQAQQCPT